MGRKVSAWASLFAVGALALAAHAGCSSSVKPVPNDYEPPVDDCVAGGSCMTGEPGACAVGSLVCERGVAKCQAPVHSAFENCFNGIDDNCNGLIDDGCPVGISVGTPRLLAVHGGTGGGTGSVQCPANTVVSQTQIWRDAGDSEMAGVTISCAAPSLTKDDHGYGFALTPVVGPAANTVKGNKASGIDPNPLYVCPDGTVAWYLNGSVGGDYVDGLGSGCAWAAVNLLDGNTLSLAFQRIDNGGADSYKSSTKFEDDCALDEAIVGYNLRVGNWLDSIQALCAPIVISYDDPKNQQP